MELPTYIKNSSQETYHQLLSQLLIQGLSDLGWTVPTLTGDNIVTVAPTMPVGTIWYNTTINKLMVNTATGVETITST